MKKTFKKMSLIFVAILSFFLGINGVSAANTRPQANQTFTFDYQFKLRLGDDLTKSKDDKNYIVPIIGYKETVYTDQVNLKGEDAVHYKVSPITEKQYNELKTLQDKIDALDKTKINNDKLTYSENEDISKLETYIKNNIWWCYDQYEVGEILLPIGCETKYYIVTVDALDTNIIEMADLNWNYHTARVYKLEADNETCKPVEETPKEDSTKEENPKTGKTTPYIISGAIVLGSIVVITTIKKKKFI